jgi:hypothetical protein
MSDKRYFTVVFQVEDEIEFREFSREMLASMSGDQLYRGASVTGAGAGDEMTRAEILLELLDGEGIYVQEELR